MLKKSTDTKHTNSNKDSNEYDNLHKLNTRFTAF